MQITKTSVIKEIRSCLWFGLTDRRKHCFRVRGFVSVRFEFRFFPSLMYTWCSCLLNEHLTCLLRKKHSTEPIYNDWKSNSVLRSSRFRGASLWKILHHVHFPVVKRKNDSNLTSLFTSHLDGWEVLRSACLFVCMSVRSHTSKITLPNFASFCRTWYPWPWLGPHLTTMQNVIYFRFCAWRHVFT